MKSSESIRSIRGNFAQKFTAAKYLGSLDAKTYDVALSDSLLEVKTLLNWVTNKHEYREIPRISINIKSHKALKKVAGSKSKKTNLRLLSHRKI